MSKPLEPFPVLEEEKQPAGRRTGHTTPAKSRRRLVLFVVLAAVILLSGGGASAYWLAAHRAQPSSTRYNMDTTGQTQTGQPAPSAAIATDTKQYTSNGQDLNLSFTYPSDWTVTPPPGGNTNDKPISVTSPLQSITNSAGKTVTGRAVVSIRPGTAQISELSSGSAVVAQDSVQFAYSKPTASQHQYPYATFVRLAGGADAANGFDDVIITGITKFMKGQNLSAESLGSLDPIISARFYTCTAACDGANVAALTITPNTWQNAVPFTQAQALFESLQLR